LQNEAEPIKHLITIPQRHGFVNFCGIYDINDFESRLEVIWGRLLWPQSKEHMR